MCPEVCLLGDSKPHLAGSENWLIIMVKKEGPKGRRLSERSDLKQVCITSQTLEVQNSKVLMPGDSSLCVSWECHQYASEDFSYPKAGVGSQSHLSIVSREPLLFTVLNRGLKVLCHKVFP